MGTHRTETAGGRTSASVVAVALLAACAGIALTATDASADTIINNNILVNTTWTVGGNPYIIQKSIVEVKNGSTLTIDPGVEVRFQANTRIVTVTPSSIVAVGALGDSISFTSNSATPATGDWYGIEVSTSTGSEFRYCKFEYGSYGLRLISSSFPVNRCAFDLCDVSLFLSRSSPQVTECWFRHPSTYNVISWYSESVHYFWHCNFILSGKDGVSRGNNIRLEYYFDPVTIDARFNWWETTNLTFIGATIYDAADGHDLGTVEYDPPLSQVPVEVSSWGRIKALFKS